MTAIRGKPGGIPQATWPASFHTGPLGNSNILPRRNGQKFLCALTGGIGYNKTQQRTLKEARETAMGRKYDVSHEQYDGSAGQTFGGVAYCEDPTQYSPTPEAYAAANNQYFMVSYTPGQSVASMNAGNADAAWAKYATYWASLKPQKIMLRAFWEFDGDFVWSVGGTSYTAAEFISAWQRMVGIFQANGADNVGFMWCPNEGGVHLTRSQLSDYYPGDAYVDWVGSDWYNHLTGFSTYLHSGFAQWAEIFNYGVFSPFSIYSTYDIFGSGAAVSGNRGWTGTPRVKPFLVGETSSPYDSGSAGAKAAWFTNMLSDANGIKSMSKCIGVSFYDRDVHSGSDFDWRVASDASVVNVTGTDPDSTTLAGYVSMGQDTTMRGK